MIGDERGESKSSISCQYLSSYWDVECLVVSNPLRRKYNFLSAVMTLKLYRLEILYKTQSLYFSTLTTST